MFSDMLRAIKQSLQAVKRKTSHRSSNAVGTLFNTRSLLVLHFSFCNGVVIDVATLLLCIVPVCSSQVIYALANCVCDSFLKLELR